MKRYFYIICPVAFIFLYACEYETLPTYSGVDQIYFEYADGGNERDIIDSTIVRFGYDIVRKTDSIISIRVKVMGSVADFDRPVNFSMVEAASESQLGRDVELLLDGSFVPAGSVTGVVRIKLNNNEALDEVGDDFMIVVLRLEESEFFKTDYTHTRLTNVNSRGNIVATEYKVWFNNASDIPNLWAHPANFTNFTNAFGEYSQKKFDLMCAILPGCTRELFTYQPGENPQEVFSERFSVGLTSAWGRALNNYLREYEILHGEPLLEDDGTVMTGGVFS